MFCTVGRIVFSETEANRHVQEESMVSLTEKKFRYVQGKMVLVQEIGGFSSGKG